MSPSTVEVRTAVVPALTVPVKFEILLPVAVSDPTTVVVSKVKSLASTRVALAVAETMTNGAPMKSLPASCPGKRHPWHSG